MMISVVHGKQWPNRLLTEVQVLSQRFPSYLTYTILKINVLKRSICYVLLHTRHGAQTSKQFCIYIDFSSDQNLTMVA